MKLHIECLQEKLDQILKDNELKKKELEKEKQEQVDLYLKEIEAFKNKMTSFELENKQKMEVIKSLQESNVKF